MPKLAKKEVDEFYLLALQSEVSQLDFHVVLVRLGRDGWSDWRPPKQEKQQIIRWDTSSHINKFVDQQDGSNNQIVVSVPTSTSGVVPNRQNAARQLYHLV